MRNIPSYIDPYDVQYDIRTNPVPEAWLKICIRYSLGRKPMKFTVHKDWEVLAGILLAREDCEGIVNSPEGSLSVKMDQAAIPAVLAALRHFALLDHSFLAQEAYALRLQILHILSIVEN